MDTAWGTSPPTKRSPSGSCTLPGCLLDMKSSLGAQALLTLRTPGNVRESTSEAGSLFQKNLDQSGDGTFCSRHHGGAAWRWRKPLVEALSGFGQRLQQLRMTVGGSADPPSATTLNIPHPLLGRTYISIIDAQMYIVHYVIQ